MKKHFLILMLMALLPLAGLAAQLSKIVVKNSYYGIQPVEGNITVYNEANAPVDAADYDVVGWFSDAACETAVELTTIAAADAGTKYYVKVTGKNGYTGTVIGSAEVAPMPLVVTANAAEKEYGTVADPAFTLSKVTKTTDLATDVKETFGTYITLGRETGEAKGTYNFTASLDASQSNYTIGSVSADTKFTITAKGFRKVADGDNPATVTITMAEEVQYNGQAQTPAIVVKDIAKDEVLTLGTDYTVVWENNINAALKTADTAPKATITGKGNYAENAIVEKFTITQAPLIVIPKAEKVYDGDDEIENVSYDYVGWLTAGDPEVTVTDTPVESADVTKYAGEYTLSVSDLTKFSSANYYFLAEDGVYKITKKDFRVKANDQTIAYGAALNQEKGATKAWTYAVEPLEADEALMDQFVMITAEGTSLVPGLKGDAAIDAIVDADAGIDGAEAKAAAKVAYKKLRDSYNLATVTEGDLNDLGTLTYTKANLTIALKESVYTLKKKYDGQNVTAPTIVEGGVYVIGEKNTGDVDITGLTVAVTDNAAAAGPYTLTLSGAVFDETKYSVTYVPSTYTIEPRPITVTLDPQVFVKGTVPTIDQTLFTVAEASETTGMGLAAGDEASEIFKLDFHKSAGDEPAYDVITFNGAGEIQNAANTYANAIVVADFATDEVTSKWDNYLITCTGGSVKILATATVLDDSKTIETEAGDDPVTVSFTTRKLNAEMWNAMVLPFEVSIKDLSDAFGYAVVDLLDETKADGNVHFKLTVAGTIPANKPFLIYPSGEKNNLNQVTFENVNLVTVDGENVYAEDGSHNKFVGTYQTTPLYGSDKLKYLSKNMWYDVSKYTEAKPCNIKPLRGYLDLTGNAAGSRAMIFIEEPDGTTTAIQAVTGDKIGSDVKADGWYTIGGMKLQGAPTQKGIYINNGKKIVVK